MRFLAGFALVFVSIAFAQSQLVIPQINTLNAVISLLPQFQGFVGQLDKILPQLAGILSSFELQSLKDKITQVVISQLGGNLNLNAIKDKLRPVLQQVLGSKPQGRMNFDTLLEQIVGAAASALPGIVLGLVGKREATDARAGLDDILGLVDKLQLNTLIPHIEQFLSGDKLQQLQSQFFATVVTALGNKWNLATVAQALEQLVSQYVPQIGQMRINWGSVAQSALDGLVSALPGLAIGAISLFGKRDATDARAGLDDILGLVDKLQLNTLIPHIEQFLGADKLQQLQSQFFATVVTALGNKWNLATVAQALEQLVSQYVPQIGQMRINWGSVAQSALDGVASALPSILMGAISIFGKREATDARAGLDDILGLVDKLQLNTLIPHIEQFLSGDKLQQLQSQFFATVVTALGNKWNLATVAQALEQLVSQYVPQIGQMRINWGSVAQSALDGLVSALPGLAIGAISLFGKRDATDARAGLDDILGLVDKLQLNTLIPHIEQFLSGDKLQQLQSQFFAIVVTALGNKWNLATVAQALEQLVSQYVPQIGQMRINWGSVAQSALDGLVSALPGLAIGAISLLGKREATDARAGLNDILALADKLQLNTLIPHIEQFLGADKLQQLQSQFFATVVTALGNKWNLATVAQALEQLVSQYVPQIGQMRINWGSVAQSALDGVASALPSILMGAISIFGKREATDARAGLDDILGLVDKLQLNTLIPHIEQFLSGDKLQQLQSQFFATVVTALGNKWNLATVAQALEQLVSQYVPQIGQMRINWGSVAQSALDGVASALPSILMGAISLFGKRDLNVDYQQLLAQLPVNKLAQLVQAIMGSDKSKVLANVRKLLQKFFPAYQGRVNFDDLAASLLSHLNNLLPALSQSIFSGILG